jgi:hypothetical protein
VKSNGHVVSISAADGDLFDAVRISLGALGIISTVTLQVEPLFYLHSSESSLTRHQLFGSVTNPSSRPLVLPRQDRVSTDPPFDEQRLVASSQLYDILYHNHHVKFWAFPHTNQTHVYTFNRVDVAKEEEGINTLSVGV